MIITPYRARLRHIKHQDRTVVTPYILCWQYKNLPHSPGLKWGWSKPANDEMSIRLQLKSFGDKYDIFSQVYQGVSKQLISHKICEKNRWCSVSLEEGT